MMKEGGSFAGGGIQEMFINDRAQFQGQPKVSGHIDIIVPIGVLATYNLYLGNEWYERFEDFYQRDGGERANSS
jgi:hypothetical protein